MRTSIIRATCLVPLALVLAGCQNKQILDVPNLVNPDVARAYSTPAGVEGVIAATFQQVWSGTMSCTDCIRTQSMNLALEDYSELNNYEMNLRALIPRAPIINDRGNTSSAANNSVFSNLSKLTRTAVNGMQAVDRLVKANAAGNALGSKAQDARAKAFGYMSLGWALGGLALVYDSAAIVVPSTPSDVVPGLSAYPDVMKAALQMLDSAIAVATSADATNGANGFPLPVTWINGNAMSAATFVQFVHTTKARFRAGVARTVAERAAVDWPSVIADVQAGLPSDFVLAYSVSAGWTGNNAYDTGQGLAPGWSGLPALMYGMADTSGGYANFIATPFGTRDGAFLIHTPDLRFPPGNTRTDQTNNSPLPLPAHLYFRNRPPGEDVPESVPAGFSYYDTRRFYGIRLNSGNGNYTAINKIEMDMLAAEGYIRAGNFASATPLINASRARNGLPAIGTITSASQSIAGGAGCVPQVPQGPGFTTVACGNIMEAMKWEKRMETSFSCMFICWWPDSRGWGDLPMNSGLQWPVPNQELDARNHLIYSYGGGLASSAPKGNYGW